MLNATASDVAAGKTFSSSAGILVTGTGTVYVEPNVYGATWAGRSSPAWTRTDKAATFSDPNPYYSGIFLNFTSTQPFIKIDVGYTSKGKICLLN